MKKNVRALLRMTAVIVTFVMITLSTQLVSYAEMVNRIAFLDLTTSVGEQFEMTMKIYALSGGNLGSADITLKYDPEYIEFVGGDNVQGGAGALKVKGLTTQGTEWDYSLKFRALKPGTTYVTLEDYEIYDTNLKAGSFKDHTGKSEIIIEGTEALSGNADLKELKISPGILTPDFDPAITDYTVLVGDDCDKIIVDAPRADENSTVVITGNGTLSLGDNIISCKVTAQNGTVKTYTITASKQEGIDTPTPNIGSTAVSSQTANVNGKEYDVAESFDETLLPDGFSVATVDYHGKSVMAAKANDRDLTLLYLLGSEGSGDFFVYNETSESWSVYVLLNVAQRAFTIVPLDEGVTVPEELKDTTLELNGKTVHGWVPANTEDQPYCVVYAMNKEGIKNFYRYDLDNTEKTVQRYFSAAAPIVETADGQYVDAVTQYNELLKDYETRGYILLGLVILSIVLLIALFITLILSSRRPSTPSGSRREYGRLDQTRRRQEKPQEEDDDDMIIAEQRPARKKQERITPEERYLRGEEEQTLDIITDTGDKEFRESLAKDVKEVQEVKDDEDDDFSTLDL